MIQRLQQIHRTYPGFTIAGVTALLLLLFVLSPSVADSLYRRGLFKVIRLVYDLLFSWLPFASAWIIVPGWIVYIIRRNRRRKMQSIRRPIGGSLSHIAALISMFFWSWGFNYCAPELDTRHQQPESIPVERLYRLALVAVERTEQALREQDSTAFTSVELSPYVAGVLRSKGWAPAGSTAKVCVIGDGGLLRQLGIAGIYFPWFGQGYTSSTYSIGESTFIQAHELAHAYGVTHEGEADFTAWLALSQHPSADVRYCAELELLLSVRRALRPVSDSLWRDVVRRSSHQVNMDILMQRIDAQLYPGFFPRFSQQVNHVYLRTMGIEQGTAAYDTFIGLAMEELQLP